MNTFFTSGMVLIGLLMAWSASNGYAADATVSDKFAQVRGFKVEFSQGPASITTVWENLVVGELVNSVDGGMHATGTMTFSSSDLRSDNARLIFLNNCKPSGCNVRMSITPAIEDRGVIVAGVPIEFSSCGPVAGFATLDAEHAHMTIRCEMRGGALQSETRQFNTLSNASKARHEAAMNSIRNMR